MRVRSIWRPAALLAMLAVAASANTLYSNLGPGDSFGGPAYTIQGTLDRGWPTYGTMMSFVSTRDTILSGIDIALQRSLIAGVAGNVRLTLNEYAGAYSLGTELVGWNLTVPSTTATLLSVAATSRVVLRAGARYSLAALPAETMTSVYWSANSTGDTGIVSTINNGSFSTSERAVGAFRVTDTAPEPGAAWLLLAGVAGFALRARFRARAVSH